MYIILREALAFAIFAGIIYLIIMFARKKPTEDKVKKKAEPSPVKELNELEKDVTSAVDGYTKAKEQVSSADEKIQELKQKLN